MIAVFREAVHCCWLVIVAFNDRNHVALPSSSSSTVCIWIRYLIWSYNVVSSFTVGSHDDWTSTHNYDTLRERDVHSQLEPKVYSMSDLVCCAGRTTTKSEQEQMRGTRSLIVGQRWWQSCLVRFCCCSRHCSTTSIRVQVPFRFSFCTIAAPFSFFKHEVSSWTHPL